MLGFNIGIGADPQPDEQARKNKSNFLNRFRSLLKNVPVGWMLWFPGGYSNADGFTPTNISSWQLLDYSHLGEVQNHVKKAFTQLNIHLSHLQGDSIELYQKKLQKSLLRGVGIVQPLNILLKKYEDRFLFLENEQKAFFENMYQIKRLAVKGGAGSGKTMLASSAAFDFSNENKFVQVLCFNKMLSRALEANLVGSNINVSTFHTFAYEYILKHDKDWCMAQTKQEADFRDDRLPKKFGSILLTNPPQKKFEVLIVDEAQDFDDQWLKMLLFFYERR